MRTSGQSRFYVRNNLIKVRAQTLIGLCDAYNNQYDRGEVDAVSHALDSEVLDSIARMIEESVRGIGSWEGAKG